MINNKGKMIALNKLSEDIDGMTERPKEDTDVNDELQKGIKCEMGEHGMEEEEATKTAQEHIDQDPKYYTKLEEMETDPNEESEMAENHEALGGEEEEEEESPKLSISVLARRNRPINKGKAR
jgi:hypothetical protein